MWKHGNLSRNTKRKLSYGSYNSTNTYDGNSGNLYETNGNILKTNGNKSGYDGNMGENDGNKNEDWATSYKVPHQIQLYN